MEILESSPEDFMINVSTRDLKPSSVATRLQQELCVQIEGLHAHNYASNGVRGVGMGWKIPT